MTSPRSALTEPIPDATDPVADGYPDWRALYEALGERVFRMLHRMTDDPDLAHDLTHDTFLRAHLARRRYDGRGSLAAWIFRIAGNVARDELRRRQVRRRHLLATPPGEPVFRTNPGLRLALAEALAALDPDQRAVVLLHEVEGYSHPEIAEMLGISDGT
ncbi:MAG: RNA polymerase sigma factor, partial [Gemmatimonadales bacterium]